jgi:hypothetical protein
MMMKTKVGMDVKGSGHVLSYGTIPVLPVDTEENNTFPGFIEIGYCGVS